MTDGCCDRCAITSGSRRAGRPQDAPTHLRRAVELAPSLVELIRDDADFAPLREYPAFTEIIGD